MWQSFESFEKATSPLILAHGLGYDGIVVNENITNRGLTRCRFYKDREIAYEMKYQNLDPFSENQFVTKSQSWGPNGTLIPYSYSSTDYKLLRDNDGFGVLCFYDEIWFASYAFSNGTGANYGQVAFEVFFRPRKVSKTDLLLWTVKNQCGRGCYTTTVDPYPCIDPACNLPQLPEPSTVKDDDIIELPSGEKVKGIDYKKPLWERIKPPCVTVCKSLSTPYEVIYEAFNSVFKGTSFLCNSYPDKANIRELLSDLEKQLYVFREKPMPVYPAKPDFDQIDSALTYTWKKAESTSQSLRNRVFNFLNPVYTVLWGEIRKYYKHGRESESTNILSDDQANTDVYTKNLYHIIVNHETNMQNDCKPSSFQENYDEPEPPKGNEAESPDEIHEPSTPPPDRGAASPERPGMEQD